MKMDTSNLDFDDIINIRKFAFDYARKTSDNK